MTTKHTILTEKDSKLLEQSILKYGKIASVNDLIKIFKQEYSTASAHNRINFLAKSGWLMRIKKGLYVIIDKYTSRSLGDMSLIRISNALQKNSYVSLDAALNYYQMFDQHTKIITAITCKSSKKYYFANHVFKFSKVTKSLYFGFAKKMQAGKMIAVADAEKALIDYLYLDKSFYSANLVLEKIKEHKNNFGFIKLQNYAAKCGITMQRKIGFLLDQINVNTDKLCLLTKNKRGYSRLTNESKLFNAKWRLYYDNRIIR